MRPGLGHLVSHIIAADWFILPHGRFLNKMERQELLSTYLVNAKSIKEAGVAAFNDDDMDDVDISFGNLEENNRPDDKTKPIIIRKGAL